MVQPWVFGKMRIEAIPPVLGQALLAATTERGEGFAARTIAASATPAEIPPLLAVTAMMPQPATSVQMLVTLAALDPVVERRRKLAAEADRGLSLLDRLHADLAGGTAAPERLQALAAWADGLIVPDDPALAQIMREIELRVRVELARHDLTA